LDTSDTSSKRLTLNVSLKTEKDIEVAVKIFNDTIHWAGWASKHTDTPKAYVRLAPIMKTRKQNITEYSNT
jgi:hypothetical protein